MPSWQSRMVSICLRALLLCEAGPGYAPRYPFMTSEFDRQMQEDEHTMVDTRTYAKRPDPSSFHYFSSTGPYRQHKAYRLCVLIAMCTMHADSATLLTSSRRHCLGRRMPDKEKTNIFAGQADCSDVRSHGTDRQRRVP